MSPGRGTTARYPSRPCSLAHFPPPPPAPAFAVSTLTTRKPRCATEHTGYIGLPYTLHFIASQNSLPVVVAHIPTSSVHSSLSRPSLSLGLYVLDD